MSIIEPKRSLVHNHGPFAGRGRNCPERLINGQIVGMCVLDEMHALTSEGPPEPTGTAYMVIPVRRTAGDVPPRAKVEPIEDLPLRWEGDDS